MGLCVLAIPEDMAQLPPEKRAVVDLAGKAAWAFASQHPDAAAAGYQAIAGAVSQRARRALRLWPLPDGNGSDGGAGRVPEGIAEQPEALAGAAGVASLQIRQGTPDQAIETLHAALKIVPAKYHWLCHTDLGRANLDANNLDAAIANWRMPRGRCLPAPMCTSFWRKPTARRGAKRTPTGNGGIRKDKGPAGSPRRARAASFRVCGEELKPRQLPQRTIDVQYRISES